MRLHHLSVTAFGPFPDTVEVDFDALSSAGVFLLTGATGAGKTSVLDAVCFALYGQVPGDRAGAKHLRSDHADPGKEPRVVLELSIGERRFRFHRSPTWTRPKLRGHGETKVQAHVVVEELRAGDWVGLTNRLDDAGLLVGDLLGMTCSQFTQVAMLPQGRFQAFLRATSAERHAVLQQLFRTDRFERVEKWLVERRGQTRRAHEAAAVSARGVLHRIEEAGGVPLPEELAEDLAAAADSGAVTEWNEQVLVRSAAARDAAAEAREAAAAVETEAAADLAEAQGRAALVRQARSATAELAALDAQRADHEERQRDLALH
ncbi:AAA family ATPase, partial [Marmoricola sp. RAF53]|uniref:AAA family ATPase n=1 Tax=Marmoricola sp. RAF53 TaxID=3233059 RepID=UPI003F9640DB